MKKLILIASMGAAMVLPAMAQDNSGNPALDELVGSWRYEACAEQGGDDCATVERTYDETYDSGLVHYTEMFGGERREGFVAYNEETGGFHELDYPIGMEHDEVVSAYGDPSTVGYFTDDDDADSMFEWRVSEDGERMSLNAMGDTLVEEETGVLRGVFTRVQQITE